MYTDNRRQHPSSLLEIPKSDLQHQKLSNFEIGKTSDVKEYIFGLDIQEVVTTYPDPLFPTLT